MSEPPALGAHLGYWLRYVSNHVSHAFALKLEALGVTVAEWVLLRELYDARRVSPSRLAARLGLTRGAVTKLADRLIGKSLIRRAADPSDGRAQTLALTATGRRLVPALAELADRNDAEFFAGLAVAERENLARILRGIVERHDLKKLPLD